MPYRIDYCESAEKIKLHSDLSNRKSNVISLVIAAILTVVVIMLCFNDSVRQFLLPGDPVVTERALSSFAENMKSGQPFTDAAYAFCREIIDGAEIQ